MGRDDDSTMMFALIYPVAVQPPEVPPVVGQKAAAAFGGIL